MHAVVKMRKCSHNIVKQSVEDILRVPGAHSHFPPTVVVFSLWKTTPPARWKHRSKCYRVFLSRQLLVESDKCGVSNNRMFRVKTSHIKLQIPLYFFVTYDVNASRVFSLVSYLFTKHCLRTQRFSRNPLYSKKRQHAGASSVCARSLNTQTLLTCWSGSVREAEIQKKIK